MAAYELCQARLLAMLGSSASEVAREATAVLSAASEVVAVLTLVLTGEADPKELAVPREEDVSPRELKLVALLLATPACRFI